jgi:hypothetical protein
LVLCALLCFDFLVQVLRWDVESLCDTWLNLLYKIDQMDDIGPKDFGATKSHNPDPQRFLIGKSKMYFFFFLLKLF